jgi:hypothetical protein
MRETGNPPYPPPGEGSCFSGELGTRQVLTKLNKPLQIISADFFEEIQSMFNIMWSSLLFFDIHFFKSRR